MHHTDLEPAKPPSPPAQATTLNPGFLLAHPAHFLALGFGTGLSPLAPGTVGTALAWSIFIVARVWLPTESPIEMSGLMLLLLALGIYGAKVTAQSLGQSDPGSIVIDEMVAFWLVLWLITPCSVLAQLGAFALFRYLDATKPLFIGAAQRRVRGDGLRGAWGIMVDDLLAAAVVIMVFAVLRF